MASGCSAAEQAACLELLWSRELAEGGFAEAYGGPYRPDATAWAILALEAGGVPAKALQSARRSLAAGQLEDGRFCLAPEQPHAHWPTAPALLALGSDPSFAEASARGIEFLLAAAGETWPFDPDSPMGHDTSLRGWSWVDGTHSWVEPTSLALLALRGAGKTEHPRYVEGFNLLLNRQLPSGGWNYGNTVGFGQELRPMVDATGLALTALEGTTSRDGVERTLTYLRKRIATVHAPFSLGWALLGLSAWDARPADAGELVRKSLQRQDMTGEYPTSALALLLLAEEAPRTFFRPNRPPEAHS